MCAKILSRGQLAIQFLFQQVTLQLTELPVMNADSEAALLRSLVQAVIANIKDFVIASKIWGKPIKNLG